MRSRLDTYTKRYSILTKNMNLIKFETTFFPVANEPQTQLSVLNFKGSQPGKKNLYIKNVKFLLFIF